MDGQTLVALIKTSRSPTEYLARNRTEIVEMLDWLRLDAGDKIIIVMQFVDNSELAGLPEVTPTMVAEYENEGDQAQTINSVITR